MRIVIDRVWDLIDHAVSEDLLNVGNLKLILLKTDWESPKTIGKDFFQPYITNGNLRVVDVEDISFTAIANLRNKYGSGIHLNNYYALQYCLQESALLMTTDPAIADIAKRLKIKLITKKEFDGLILVENLIAQETVKYINMKRATD